MDDRSSVGPITSHPGPGTWEELCVAAPGRQAYEHDLYFRECWADIVDVAGSRAVNVLQSLALVNVKPDAVVGRRSGAVVSFAIEHGFVPLGARVIRLTRHSMRELWRYDWRVYPVDRLAFSTLWYTSTDIVVFAFRDVRPVPGVPGATRFSGLKGDARAEKRRAGDLRTVLRPPNRVLNFVHVADSPADVVRELAIFLDRTERRRFLEEIAANADAERDVLDTIATLESRHPPHDLDPEASIERLERSSAISRSGASRLRSAIGAGGSIAWADLCRIVNPADPRVDRWDFISVASTVIPLERTVPDVPSVSRSTGRPEAREPGVDTAGLADWRDRQ